MSTWMLVLILLNPQGHNVYKSPGSFSTLTACTTRADQLALNPKVKATMCVEQYHGYISSDNHANK